MSSTPAPHTTGAAQQNPLAPDAMTAPATDRGEGTGTGTFTLLLFAAASTFTGGLETLHLRAPTTLGAVFRTLETRFPGISHAVLRSAAVTVNLEYVDFDPDEVEGGDERDGEGEGESKTGMDLVINPGDEVGIIPPVSSG
ncbi:uncharacterized protein Z519_12360 [Cladophialophora bantiana CBS 173.52]|uniref:Molybdopterin synthase sulfur carrier subunit n=1 Tax=Cladophialophora bantiana (strain ATCC 10958 / CBS 173.52 / CDC B-1940 / NIH 8579) TaxID=1442370 RepID=A0A0D2H1F5_CLAB1|nr:uncharacterized protein Z519_12360 [Cladophialophora bantiana CBS 173.52]KIW87063.1 hypothetical protein Z519_12360 [Cladophialophora bantiana CBS 173.52]